MLTLPMLQNSSPSPVPPIKNAASAADATDAAGAGAGQKAAGFSEVLEQEMKEKDDVPNAGAAAGNTTSNKDSNGAATGTAASAEEMTDRSVEIKDDREAAVITAAIMAAPPFIALANMQQSRVTGYSPGGSAGNRVDASVSALADAADNLAAEQSQAEPAVTAAQQIWGAALQAGVVAALPGQAGSEPVTVANDRIVPQTVPGTARLAADIPLGMASETPTIDARGGGTNVVIKEDTAIKSGLATRKGAFSRLELDVPESRLPEPDSAIDAEKTTKFLAEVAHQSLSAAPVEAAMAVVATERSPASAISNATAGTPVYTALGLEPRLDAPGWDNALGQKVLWMVSQQQQVAELSLNPPDLGPLQVVLSINGDQASAMFVSQQADVRQALEAALPRLKEMMADSGINLSNTTVSSDSPQQQREFERQGRSGARYGGGGDGGGGQGIDISAAHIRSGGSGLVDTFA
jgi:flagellar hook-length control protein FliK